MKRTVPFISLAALALMLSACGDDAAPTAIPLSSSTAISAQRSHEIERTVTMMDACDPESFNAVLGDGSCVRSGGITFDRFIAQLTKLGRVPAWLNAPSFMKANVGDVITAINRGGEVHTFTEVAAFGGGFVTELNAASGNPVPAPECLAISSLIFVPPGGSTSEEVDGPGTERYQCCLHPWMRTTVVTR